MRSRGKYHVRKKDCFYPPLLRNRLCAGAYDTHVPAQPNRNATGLALSIIVIWQAREKECNVHSCVTARKVYVTVTASRRQVTIPRQEISFSLYTVSPSRQSRAAPHGRFSTLASTAAIISLIYESRPALYILISVHRKQ